MKKPIIIIASIITVGALAYFTYPIARNRYFPPTGTNTEKKSGIEFFSPSKEQDQSGQSNVPAAENQPTGDGQDIIPSPSGQGIIDNSIGSTADKNARTKTNIKANITAQHCSDDCKAFASDLVLFAYCQEVCGISPIKNDADCDSKKDLEKDYCQKNLAITKTDAALCEKIADDNIRKTCQNRIAEDLVEKVQEGNHGELK